MFLIRKDLFISVLSQQHGLLGVKYTDTQVQFLGTWLKGNASEWFTRNVGRPDRPIRDWSLESVIEGLQKWFLNSLTHRQVSNKFDTIEQKQKTVQGLIQELTKYAAWMVQYPDDYSFRRWLIAALWPSLQKEVLCRGITAEFSSMQDILEKVKDIEDSSRYDIGSQMPIETMHNSAYANQVCVRALARLDLFPFSSPFSLYGLSYCMPELTSLTSYCAPS